MKSISTLAFFLLLFINPLELIGETYKGYIITIDQKKITGTILQIFYSDIVSEVVFKNDFGDYEYNFKAGIIYGFVFTKENGENVIYESKRYKRRWFFLKLDFKGDKINYYKSPEIKSTPGNAFSGYAAIINRVDESWIEYEGKMYKLIPIRWRKRVKKIFSKHPAIIEKLDQPDLQLTDIKELVRIFNDRLCKRG